jgi:hypothetical protein
VNLALEDRRAARIAGTEMRFEGGSWDRMVDIVLRMNWERVMRWEEEMSTIWRSVLRRKME